MVEINDTHDVVAHLSKSDVCVKYKQMIFTNNKVVGGD